MSVVLGAQIYLIVKRWDGGESFVELSRKFVAFDLILATKVETIEEGLTPILVDGSAGQESFDQMWWS